MAEKVYFGVEIKEKFYLPETNKEQWIEVRKFNASQKSLYLNSIGGLSKMSSDGKALTMDTTKAGDLEGKILELAVVGYRVNVIEGGETKLLEGIDPNEWSRLYKMMDASIAEGLLAVVKQLNPWLLPLPDQDKKK